MELIRTPKVLVEEAVKASKTSEQELYSRFLLSYECCRVEPTTLEYYMVAWSVLDSKVLSGFENFCFDIVCNSYQSIAQDVITVQPRIAA